MLSDILAAVQKPDPRPLTLVLIAKLMMELVFVNGQPSCLREEHTARLKQISYAYGERILRFLDSDYQDCMSDLFEVEYQAYETIWGARLDTLSHSLLLIATTETRDIDSTDFWKRQPLSQIDEMKHAWANYFTIRKLMFALDN
eukprot:EC792234.1.p1 GENE.EC792234.1~~EC792234.1.p1  ORF type:complete len:167 (+),score=23.27 EC792234.1:70-501(+)